MILHECFSVENCSLTPIREQSGNNPLRVMNPSAMSGMIFCIFLFMCVPASRGLAGYITIETAVQTTLKEDALTVSVGLANNGDEPAHNVRISVETGGNSQAGDIRETLGVKERLKEEFHFMLTFQNPGKYPVIIRTDFADANQHPFSALSLKLINYRKTVSPRVFFHRPERLEIAKKGELKLKLKSLDESERDVTVRLILPKELGASAPEKRVRIAPRKEKEISFVISNFSAFVGARQPVFALLEYDEGNIHCSVSTMNIIEIIEKEKLTRKMAITILGIPVGLLLLFLLILRIKKIKDEG